MVWFKEGLNTIYYWFVDVTRIFYRRMFKMKVSGIKLWIFSCLLKCLHVYKCSTFAYMFYNSHYLRVFRNDDDKYF